MQVGGDKLVRRVGLAALAVVALAAAPAHAWKVKTHLYIANVIRADALDGKVWIPPFGEFSISPEARIAINNEPDYFRGGAVGPDHFPDPWTGQAYIHPNTGPWLRHLWNSAVADDTAPVWAFTYGTLVHCAADVFGHDWVNYYSGGAYPSMQELLSNPALLSVIARHTALEVTVDKRINLGEKSIRIPYNFVLNKLILAPEAQQVGLNPLIQHYVSLYWEKYQNRNDTILGFPSYDAEWFLDLGADLSYWVMANERATKRAVEQGEGLVDAYTSELGEWAFLYILDMEGVPSVSTDAADVILTLSGAVQDALRALGLDTILNDIRNKFVDYMLRTTLGMTEQQFKSFLLAEADQSLFPNSLNAILDDLGYPPPENGWVHDNKAHSFFQQTIRTINGALYNSVILGKIALLPPSELNRLTRSNYYSGISLPNALVGFLKGIDFSTQWLQGSGYGGFLGYYYPPNFPTFTYLFKPSPPGRSDASLWVRPGTQVSAVIKATAAAPDGSSVFSGSGRLGSGSYLLIRKKSATTGAWQEVSGSISDSGVFTSLELPFEYGTEYLVRPVHGSMDFVGSAVVKFDTPVDLREVTLGMQAASSSGYNQAAYAGLLDPFYEYKAPTMVRPWCQLVAPQQPLGVEGNAIGLPSSAQLKLTNCCLRVDGNYGPALAGMSGVLLVDPRESGIAPVVPVKIGFTVDMNGVARWRAANLAEAARGSDQVTLKAGSHPGPLVMRVLFDVTDASLAGARVAEGYRRVQAALKAIPAGQNVSGLQAVTLAVTELPQTIGNAATAESQMRAAIAGMSDARVKQDLLQRFDEGLASFPVLAARGLIPAPDSPWFSVQPNLGGADSSAIPPSFTAAALAPPPAEPKKPGEAPAGTKAAEAAPDLKTPKEPLPAAEKPAATPTPPSGLKPADSTPATPAPPTTLKTADGGPAAATPPTGLRPADGTPGLGGERALGDGPLMLALRRLEYRATPIRAGSELIVPGAAEKLLVVRFTLRNDQSEEAVVYWSTVSFTAADAMGMNREGCGDLFNEQTGESVDATLLPGQKIDAYTVVTLPARGPAAKLLAQPESGNPLEYSLGGAVAVLEAPFADPGDPTGTTALAEVPAAVGWTFPVDGFAVTVDKIAYTLERIRKRAPAKGSRYLVASLRVKNQAPGDQALSWDSFDFALRSPQAEDIAWNQELLTAVRDEEADLTLAPGREVAVRVYFEVPQDSGPRTLCVRRGEGARSYLIDLGGVK